MIGLGPDKNDKLKYQEKNDILSPLKISNLQLSLMNMLKAWNVILTLHCNTAIMESN